MAVVFEWGFRRLNERVNRFSIQMSGLLSNIQASMKSIARFQNKQNADYAPHPSDDSRDQVELVEEQEPEIFVGRESSNESDSQSGTEEESPLSIISQASPQSSPSDARTHDGFWTSSLKPNDALDIIFTFHRTGYQKN